MARSRSCWLLIVGAAAILLGCGPFPAQTTGRKAEPRLAPEIQGNDADGNPMKLSDFRGKVVLLDFWATT